MAIVKTYSLNDFIEEFRDWGRDYYSLEGYKWMYELLNECYYDSNFEMDVIALCGDFSEENVDYIIDYSSDLKEWYNSYIEENEEEPTAEEVAEELNNYTMAYATSETTIIYQEF